jgi:YVTN family beta-propeller protein
VWNAADNRVYVGDGTSGTIGVIDGATNAKLASLSVRRNIYAMVSDPLRNKLYATSESTDTVSAVDCGTGTVAAVRGSMGTTDICFNPVTRRVYAMAYSASKVDVIDGVEDTLITSIAVGYTPQHIICNPTNNKVYVSDWNDNNLKIVDGVTNTVTRTLTFGENCEWLCYNPTDNKVYCALRMNNQVKVLDGATDSVLATVNIAGRPSQMAYNPRDNRIYCVCSSGDYVAVIDGITNAVVASIDVGDLPSGLAVDTAANKVWCANYNGNSVTVINSATLAVDATVPVGRHPVAVGYNPVNSRIYVVNNDSMSVSVLRDGEEAAVQGIRAASRPVNRATVSRGVLHLAAEFSGVRSSASRDVSRALLDASGHTIMRLHEGDNDVTRLAPGAYVVCERQGGESRQLARVILAR